MYILIRLNKAKVIKRKLSKIGKLGRKVAWQLVEQSDPDRFDLLQGYKNMYP